ncbi:hypothetical protein [Paraburkholderia dinghuensis]|nr:hypothetical protein [Paraburkholderia dinghuensis]
MTVDIGNLPLRAVLHALWFESGDARVGALEQLRDIHSALTQASCK